MRKKNPALITPEEMARVLGKTNPESIRSALRRGTYPIGMAYQTGSDKWVYDVPRAPFEEFARTGRVPKEKEVS